MKTRETKQKDLEALSQSLQASTSAMVVTFSGVTVAKDQEFRNRIREAGANYQVVKNTLARIAVKGTQFEDVTGSLKGVTAIAWTDNDPVVLSKAISKFMKDNADHFTFKTGVVDGKSVDLTQLTTIANLPSKEELISKLLFVINAQAQRIVTVINAVPRNLAVVIDQIGKQEGRDAGTPAAESAPVAEEQAPAAESAPAEDAAPTEEAPANEGADDAAAETVAEPAETTPDVSTEAQEEATAAAPDDAAAAAAEPNESAQSPDDKAEEVVGETPAE